MSEEDPDSPKLPKLLSVPGLMAVAIFGISVIVVSRLFGPENILREIVTELLASFGSTILLFAVFGFFFRSGLRRLLRWAPGGETFEESVERLRELLQDFDVRGRESLTNPRRFVTRRQRSGQAHVEDVAFTAIFTSVGPSTQYMVCWASSVRREILKPEAAVTGRSKPSTRCLS